MIVSIRVKSNPDSLNLLIKRQERDLESIKKKLQVLMCVNDSEKPLLTKLEIVLNDLKEASKPVYKDNIKLQQTISSPSNIK